MKTIKKTETYVLKALEENPRARKDDFILYGAVLKRIGIDLKNTTLYDFLATAQQKKLPSLEGVPRARRKIFEKHPELENEQTQIYRERQEDKYIKYSRE